MPSKRQRPGWKIDKTGRSVESQKHVRLYERMLASPAYRSLSLAGRAALLEFNRIYNGANNGEIAMSVRRLASLLGVANNTANKAIWELEEKGFVRLVQPASFAWKKRRASTYVLTQHPFRDEPATKDFMRWRPGKGFPSKGKNSSVSNSETHGLNT